MTNLATQLSDYSVEDAVNAMPDIEAMEAANPELQQQPPQQDARPNDTIRGEDGRYKAREPEPVKAEPEKVEAKDAEPEADDDDPFVEFPTEEGKDPVREKLSKVWEGYQRVPTLEKELETAKTSQRALLPHEVEQVVQQVNGERQKLIGQLQQIERFMQPQSPDMSMINPASANYNPEEFHRQVTVYQTQTMRLAEVQQQIKAQQDASLKEQEAVARARAQRDWQRIQEVWPEFKSDEVRAKAVTDLKSRYGFDDATIQSVSDPRFYALAKDALAYREAKAKEAEAVKVVKMKPKLVSSVARQNVTSQQRASADGLKRLSQTGSLEDAAAALDGLF